MQGGPLDIWHDASGHKHNLLQLVPAARPKFLRTPEGALVRFDGEDDFMAATGGSRESNETTIFIVACPRSNKNAFSAFLALNREGENDYQTGLNVDMANGAKTRFDFLNVEGPGFVGIKNVMTSSVPFGQARVISLMTESGTNDVRAWIDGIPQEQYGREPRPPKVSRNRNAAVTNDRATLSANQVTVGARFFSNTIEPAHVQGFFDGDIIEVLLYDRILTPSERVAVEDYLKQKLVAKVPGEPWPFWTQSRSPRRFKCFFLAFLCARCPST